MLADVRLSDTNQMLQNNAMLNNIRINMQKKLKNDKIREFEKRLSDSRRSGVLAGISNLNLAGNENIGTYEDLLILIDFLKETNQTLLQLLPIGPVHKKGNYSPYALTADDRFNILNISLNKLCKKGFLSKEDLPKLDGSKNVNYEKVEEEKIPVLYKAYYNAKKGFPKDSNHEGYRLDDDVKFKEYCLEEGIDLDNYAIFAVLNEKLNLSFDEWNSEYKLRTGDWRDKVENEYKDEIEAQKFFQYNASKDWDEVIDYANDADVTIIGDRPAFFGQNNVRVWSDSSYVQVDKNKKPTKVPGVPGQIWTGLVAFYWENKKLIDLLMKGIHWTQIKFHETREDCPGSKFNVYTFDAGCTDPYAGSSEKANGWELYKRVREKYPNANLIMETIGGIPEDVMNFFKENKFICMKVAQYGVFGNDHTPDNYNENEIAYIGTHDTLPTKGWFDNLNVFEKDWLMNYTGCNDHKYIVWALWNKISHSKAKRVIMPLWDVAELGADGAINSPGQDVVPGGQKCWTRRISMEEIVGAKESLRCLADESGRVVKKVKGRGRDVKLFILPGDVLKHVDALLNKEVAVTR